MNVTKRILFSGLTLTAGVAFAGVLPEERADLMYHSYSGGGMDINGPSLLIRKNFADVLSVAVNYYEDHVSSASVDVESYASPYSEERIEQSLNLEYLHDSVTMNAGYSHSVESDYLANTYYFAISRSFFGDLSTLSMGTSKGDDEVGKVNEPGFSESVSRLNLNLSWSQILSKNLVTVATVETITDDGYLQNPYRAVRYLDSESGRGYTLQGELYPQTRASDAFALRAMYYLPWRASLRLEGRSFQDSWGIRAQNAELRYAHPWDDNLIVEAKLRFYKQSKADFYSDLFSRYEAQNFLARDKELSSYQAQTIGVGATYVWKGLNWPIASRLSANLYVDYMRFDYDDFRDIREVAATPGTEPLYAFDAVVSRLFVSFWF